MNTNNNQLRTVLFAVTVLVLLTSALAHADNSPLIITPGTGDLFYGTDSSATVGNLFTVGAKSITITSLGLFDTETPGLDQSHSVGLWTTSGTLLARIDFSSGLDGFENNGFIYQNLPNPVILQPGVSYVLGAYYPTGSTDGLYVNDTIQYETWSSSVSFYGLGRYTPDGSGFIFPNLTVGGLSYVGANALYSVPEPPTTCVPSPSGLVGWWRAEGDANDSVAGNNGILQNVGFTNGVVGQAFAFYGYFISPHSQISVPDQPIFELTDSLSIEGWINPAGAGGYSGTILWRGDCRGGYDPYFFQMNGDNTLGFYIEDASNNLAAVNTSTPLANNQWYHVAATLDGNTGTMSIYTNGVLAAQTNTSIRPFGPLIPSLEPTIGIGNVGTPCWDYVPFNGDLDEISLYSRALSQSEIQAIYNAGSSGKCVPAPVVPIITSFSPQSGAAGTVVNIIGLNFNPTPGNNIVYFGAVRATVTIASETNLTVIVPVGATYAPITETVNGLTAWANAPFLPTYPGSGDINSSSLAPRLDLAADNSSAQAVIADMDGDGKPDLIILNGSLNGNSPSVSIFRNISTNGSLTTDSFAPRVDLSLGVTTTTGGGMTVADLDGDGRLDIVVTSFDPSKVSIFQNFCSPGSITSNSFGARVDIPVSGGSCRVAVMDLDGDGKPDIAIANYYSNTVSILRNIGSKGTITSNSFAAPVYFPVPPTPRQIAIADLDGDGKPDVVTANYVDWSTDTNNMVSVLRNISTVGNISFASTVSFPGVATSCNLAIGDLDGDGKLDLVVSSFNYGQAVSVYRNVSTPGSITTNSFAPHVDFAVGGWGNDVAIGDLDGDGKPDLAVVTQLPDHLSLFKNISTPGSFTINSLAPIVDFTAGYNPNGVVIGDLDGDGRPDIVFGNTYNNTISIYRNVIPANHPPVADAGSDQTVYAWIDGIAEANLDGSGSYDEDNDPLTYKWTWSIDGNDYEANGINPTIELPVGEHEIELIVNDGWKDSEPNYTVIDVIEPAEGTLQMSPQIIFGRCQQQRIMAMLRLPDGITKDQIDSNSALLLYPGEIEAVSKCILPYWAKGTRHVSIFAFFDKDEVLDAIDGNGPVQVYVVGQLKTGQYFYGSDTMRIINPGRRPPRCNMRDWFHYWNWHQPCAPNRQD